MDRMEPAYNRASSIRYITFRVFHNAILPWPRLIPNIFTHSMRNLWDSWILNFAGGAAECDPMTLLMMNSENSLNFVDIVKSRSNKKNCKIP